LQNAFPVWNEYFTVTIDIEPNVPTLFPQPPYHTFIPTETNSELNLKVGGNEEQGRFGPKAKGFKCNWLQERMDKELISLMFKIV